MRLSLKKIIPRRTHRLRVLLWVLVICSVLYAVSSIAQLRSAYQVASSWQGLLHREWESGAALTRIISSGLFQLFILILGWSVWFRLYSGEVGHQRLRRSEQKYRSIINHAGEAIFLVDRQGLILEWNKGAEKLFQIPRRNSLNNYIADIGLKLDLDFDHVFAETERVQRGIAYEVKLDRGDGYSPLIRMTFSLISPSFETISKERSSFVVIARDITSERQMEARMSETEKLAGIGQLAAGIAHQLNTPLGSILLSAQMLEETVTVEDDVEDIRRIIRQTEQCRGIIKGLLNFSRPTGFEKAQIDLMEAVQETVYLLDKNLKVANVTVEKRAETDPSVYGNRNEMAQVFFNLLANSIDAMPEGGSIDILIKDGDPGEVLVEFKDTGEGIAQKDIDKIFLPFYTTKDYGKGTGLGLSIVARIVHEHGGRIELDSKPGRGTLFRLSFPRARRGISSPTLIDDRV